MFWYIDPSHTAVNFSVKHMMLSTVRGSLGKVSGRIELDPAQPEKGDFEVAAAVKGITTGDARRDGHLQSADFFDAEKYPEVTFKSNVGCCHHMSSRSPRACRMSAAMVSGGWSPAAATTTTWPERRAFL